MEKYWQIGKENLKFHMPPHLLAAAVLLLASPLVLGIRNLPEPDTCKVMEYYVSLIGIVLLVPVFLPEQDENLRELLRAKYTSQACVYAIRMAEACGALAAALGIYLAVLKWGNCAFPLGPVFWGSFATVLFLGGLGAAVCSLSLNLAAGYMIYLLSFMRQTMEADRNTWEIFTCSPCPRGSTGLKYCWGLQGFYSLQGQFSGKNLTKGKNSICKNCIKETFLLVKKELKYDKNLAG